MLSVKEGTCLDRISGEVAPEQARFVKVGEERPGCISWVGKDEGKGPWGKVHTFISHEQCGIRLVVAGTGPVDAVAGADARGVGVSDCGYLADVGEVGDGVVLLLLLDGLSWGKGEVCWGSGAEGNDD